MLSLMATLAELVSMAPTSGGQYHWVSMLAPLRYQRFLGYMTAWLTVTGWQATLASSSLLTGTLIQNIVLLTHPSYAERMENWHGTMLLWAVLLLIYAINTSLPRLFVKFEGYAFVLHLLGFFAVMLPLIFLGEKTSSANVWNQFKNMGEWHTQGLSFCIGIIGTVFAFAGADAAIHVSCYIYLKHRMERLTLSRSCPRKSATRPSWSPGRSSPPSWSTARSASP